MFNIPPDSSFIRAVSLFALVTGMIAALLSCGTKSEEEEIASSRLIGEVEDTVFLSGSVVVA